MQATTDGFVDSWNDLSSLGNSLYANGAPIPASVITTPSGLAAVRFHQQLNTLDFGVLEMVLASR